MRFTRDILRKVLLPALMLALAAIVAAPVFAQNFLQPKVIPTGNWPAAVYSADVNNDGYPDLVYIDQGATPGQPSTTHVLLNDGKGNFTQSATIATVGNSLAIGTIGGNGSVSVGWITLSPSGFVINVAGGKGDGTFQTTHAFAADPFPLTSAKPIQLGYLTQGRLASNGANQYSPEIIAEDIANNIVYAFVFNPDGTTVADAGSLPDGPGPAIVVTLSNSSSAYGTLVVNGLTGYSAQVFSNGVGLPVIAPTPPSSRFTGLTGIHSLLFQDVNLDGRPDLIAEGTNGHIDVFPGNGDGTFQSTPSGGSGTLDGTTGNGGHLIATGDFNHDGQLDALAATPAGISVLLGQGTQYLGLKGIYNAGPGPSSGHSSYVLADFNHDGNPDLAVDSPEGIAILYGNSDGSFQTSRAYAAGQPAMSGALAKFTSSGHLDAVVSTGATQAQALLGDGTGAFTTVGGTSPVPTQASNGTAGYWSSIVASDLNGDGIPDIAITADGGSSAANGGVLLPLTSAGPPSGLTLQYGNGDGTFQGPIGVTGPLGVQQTANSPASFYGVSTNLFGTNNASLFTRDASAYRLTTALVNPIASRIFGTQTTFTNHPHNLVVANPVLGIIEQQEGHLFEYRTDLSLLGDLAVDGSLTTPGQLVAPDISPTFPGASTTLGFRAFPGSATIADLDNDGNPDLIAAYDNLDADHTAPTSAHPNKIYIWYGSGVSKFLTSTAHPVNPVVLTPSRNFYQVAVADINGDGVPDLILSDGYIVSVQPGKGDGTFGAETHYLAGQGINGIAFGDLRKTGHNDLVIANGGAVLSNPVANLEKLAANPDVNTGGVTVLLNQVIPVIVPTATLTASPEPSIYGNAFTLVLTFSNPASQPIPSGIVTFSVDGVIVASTSIIGINSPGVIYTAPNTLSVGPHVLTASYTGDSNYQAITFTGTHTVAAVTSNSVVANPEPSVYGSSFILTATAPGPGTFQFSVDGASVGTVASTTNTASVSVPGTVPVGINHVLNVLWFAPNSAIGVQITGTHTVTINPTTVNLLLCVDNPGSLFPCGNPIGTTPLISPITFFYGQSLDGVATESASNLTGNIVFYDGTRVFCSISANLAGGANMCPLQSGFFHSGSRVVYATYTGDPNNAASNSNSIYVTVYPDPTTAKLNTSLTPAVVGTSITFTAVLAGNFATPTGAVNFYDGTTLLGGGSLDPSGTVAFTTSTLAVGSHPITVVYAGTSDFNPITSAIVTQVITGIVTPPPPGAGFTLAVTPNPITVGAGATGALRVVIAAQSASTPAVALTCSGLPYETTCTFVTPTIPSGGGITTLQLHITAPHDCGSTTPYFIGSTDGPASPVPYTFAAVFFGAFAVYKRRRKKLILPLTLLLISLASLASLSGCGACTDLGTRPGDYTFTVIATPQGTTSTPAQSVTIPLTVTIP